MTMSPSPSIAKLFACIPFSSKSWGNTTVEEKKTILNQIHIEKSHTHSKTSFTLVKRLHILIKVMYNHDPKKS